MTDSLAPFAGEHHGHIYAVTEPPYTVAWFAGCECGFVGDQRESPGAAAADLIGHRPPKDGTDGR